MMNLIIILFYLLPLGKLYSFAYIIDSIIFGAWKYTVI